MSRRSESEIETESQRVIHVLYFCSSNNAKFYFFVPPSLFLKFLVLQMKILSDDYKLRETGHTEFRFLSMGDKYIEDE